MDRMFYTGFLISALAGCGVRDVVRADGARETSFFVGLASAPTDAVSGDETLLGAWIRPGGGGIGYRSLRYVTAAAGCGVTIWPGRGADAHSVAMAVSPAATACGAPRETTP